MFFIVFFFKIKNVCYFALGWTFVLFRASGCIRKSFKFWNKNSFNKVLQVVKAMAMPTLFITTELATLSFNLFLLYLPSWQLLESHCWIVIVTLLTSVVCCTSTWFWILWCFLFYLYTLFYWESPIKGDLSHASNYLLIAW